MLEMVSGALVALCFLGLPLAIIGLFIASTLDRRNARPPQGFTASGEVSASASATNHADDKRRRVMPVFGGHDSISRTLRSTRTHGRKV